MSKSIDFLIIQSIVYSSPHYFLLSWRTMASFRGASEWHENMERGCEKWIEREKCHKTSCRAASKKSQTHSSLAPKWRAIEWQIVRAFNFQLTWRHSKKLFLMALERRNVLWSLWCRLIEFQTFWICRWWARRLCIKVKSFRPRKEIDSSTRNSGRWARRQWRRCHSPFVV